MKLQRHRFGLIALLLCLFLLAACALLLTKSLRSSSLPPPLEESRLLALKESVIPGSILDRGGRTLASTDNGVRKYQDSAQSRASVVHVVGVESGWIPGGVESLHIASLYGLRPTLSEALSRLIRKQERHGYDLTLTISAELCEELVRSAVSHPETAGKNCAAVVVQYLTGEVVALVSLPTVDPAKLEEESARSLLSAADQPLLNRVTEALCPLGPLTQTFSSLSGVFRSGALSFRDLEMAAPEGSKVTPLQLCLMTCAVAGGGTAPEPRLIRTVRTNAGGVVVSWSSADLGRLCSPEDADTLKSVMKASVTSGPASSLYDPVLDLVGLSAAAEETDDTGSLRRYSWFTGFNAQKDLPFAVCLLLENPDPEKAETCLLPMAHDCFTWLKNHPNLFSGSPPAAGPTVGLTAEPTGEPDATPSPESVNTGNL